MLLLLSLYIEKVEHEKDRNVSPIWFTSDRKTLTGFAWCKKKQRW